MEKLSIDAALKRLAYTTTAELGFAASLTLIHSETLSYFGQIFFAMWASFFAIPLALFTDIFSSLGVVEWYVIVIAWIVSFTMWQGYE